MKIVILDGYALNPGDLDWNIFSELGEVTVYDRTPAEETIKRIGDAQCIITNKTVITSQVVAACKNLKYIGVTATGYNIIDTDATGAAGITVTNVPGYSTPSVAQAAFALLLEICFQIGVHDTAVKAGQWESSPDYCFWNRPLIELKGKTLGIIGMGTIGYTTAKIAAAFGMKVLGYRRNPDKSMETADIKFASLDTLYSSSDVISLHCPQTKETIGIINSESITKMKDGVILINTSRGELVEDNAVVAALDSGKISYMGTDVAATEPPTADNKLVKHEKCYVTPHIAWAPLESRTRLFNTVLGNLKDFSSGVSTNVVS